MTADKIPIYRLTKKAPISLKSELCHTNYDKKPCRKPHCWAAEHLHTKRGYEPCSHHFRGTWQDCGGTWAKGQDNPTLQLPLLLVSPS